MYYISRIILLSIGFFALAWLSVPAGAAENPHSQESQLKNPDGTWRWTNKLSGETSPYLLLHAHNPVDWYPVGARSIGTRKSGA